MGRWQYCQYHRRKGFQSPAMRNPIADGDVDHISTLALALCFIELSRTCLHCSKICFFRYYGKSPNQKRGNNKHRLAEEVQQRRRHCAGNLSAVGRDEQARTSLPGVIHHYKNPYAPPPRDPLPHPTPFSSPRRRQPYASLSIFLVGHRVIFRKKRATTEETKKKRTCASIVHPSSLPLSSPLSGRPLCTPYASC